MDLLLNDILRLSDDEIANSKIELGMTSGAKGKPKIEEWLFENADIKMCGKSICSFWARKGKNRNYYPGQLAFSFIRICDDEWLFISAAKILGVPEIGYAEYEPLEKYKPFFGRMIVRYKKENTFSNYVFRMQTYMREITVKEILPCPYSGKQFEGYDKVNLTHEELRKILEGKIMPTYREALAKISGIYCLTDRSTGKLYIGSAYGEGGLARRWGDYLDSKHGNNKKLRTVFDKNGRDYFVKNFTFTIIEFFGKSYDPCKIIEREQFWKRCFDTINNGYNDN